MFLVLLVTRPVGQTLATPWLNVSGTASSNSALIQTRVVTQQNMPPGYGDIDYSDSFTSDQLNLIDDWANDGGLPWLAQNKIARDPSSNHKQTFALWQAEENAAYLISRPCYFGDDSASCHPGLWANARYSAEVVNSLASVIRSLHARHVNSDIRIVGYSGGGVLAVLLAEKLLEVVEVVTYASPLGINKWAHLHGFSKLDKSINPLDVQLRPSLKQRHFIGKKDRNVPYEINKELYRRQGVEPIIVDGFTHDSNWPSLRLER